jgi:ATP-dependent DNA helicase RecG
MNQNELKQLIAKSEGKTLDFKRDLSGKKGIVKDIIAFANGAGGRLVIGVDNDKTIRGIEDPFTEEERLINIISDNIFPQIMPDIQFATVYDKTLLIVTIYPGSRMPYYEKSGGRLDGVYVRIGSSARKADKEMVEELERRSQGRYFDEEICPRSTSYDIDISIPGKLYSGKKVNTQFLKNLKILVTDQDNDVATNGGILLFGKSRQDFFPDAWIHCGRFKGKTKADIIDHAEILTNPIDAISEVEAFVMKHAMKTPQFDGMKPRKDIWNVPLNALRELVVNALVHADYSVRGVCMSVFIYDNRIVVENAGCLMPGLTVDQMISGTSRHRNPVIARVFHDLELIEKFGSGYDKISQDLRLLGLKKPLVEEFNDRIRVTIFVDITKPGVIHSDSEETNSDESDNTDKSLSKTEILTEKILRLANEDGKIKSSEVEELIGKSQRTARRLLNRLVDDGILEVHGGTKSRYYTQA